MQPINQLICTLTSSAGQMCIHAYLHECQLLCPLLWWAPKDTSPQDLLYHIVDMLSLPISLRVVSHTMQKVGT